MSRSMALRWFSAPDLALVGAIVLLTALFGAIIGPRFLSSGTLVSFGFQLPELAILSLAMMIAMMSGGLNLAVVSTANLCSLTIGHVLAHLAKGQQGQGLLLAIAIAMLAGFAVALAIGAVIGWLVAYLQAPPILATLGATTLIEGISVGISQGSNVTGFPDLFAVIGSGTVLGVPIVMVILLACMVPMDILFQHSPLGTAIRMIGANQRATYFSGVDTRSVILRVYLLSSLLACVAGIVMMSRFNSASASYGSSYLLITILACVLGGVDPFGGKGRVTGLFLGLIVLQVISSAFNLLGFNSFLALASWGMVLLLTSVLAARRR